jgi:hypothetical protein
MSDDLGSSWPSFGEPDGSRRPGGTLGRLRVDAVFLMLKEAHPVDTIVVRIARRAQADATFVSRFVDASYPWIAHGLVDFRDDKESMAREVFPRLLVLLFRIADRRPR